MYKHALAGLVIAAAFASGARAVPVDCTTLGTLQDFVSQSANGGCFVQDKLFTSFSYTGGGAVTASQVDVAVAFSPGSDVHGLTLTPSSGSPVWTSGFTFGYTIQVFPPDPLLGIGGASLQINLGVLSNPTTVSSTKGNGLVQTASFGSQTDIDTFTPVATLTSSTVVTIPSGGFLISLEEHYVQTVVPEPQSVLLLGGGLAGLAWCLRRLGRRGARGSNPR